ncbi:MAG: hypothetical protein QM605_10540 [Sphingobium sp.]
MMTVDQIMERWRVALNGNLPVFSEVCAPDCQVWHSSDNNWMSAAAAMEGVAKMGGLPPFDKVEITKTDKGFAVQGSITPPGMGKMHIAQMVTVKEGSVAAIEEYISPEMDLRAQTA